MCVLWSSCGPCTCIIECRSSAHDRSKALCGPCDACGSTPMVRMRVTIQNIVEYDAHASLLEARCVLVWAASIPVASRCQRPAGALAMHTMATEHTHICTFGDRRHHMTPQFTTWGLAHSVNSHMKIIRTVVRPQRPQRRMRRCTLPTPALPPC